jgi:serine/threonine-protein kinase RsbT
MAVIRETEAHVRIRNSADIVAARQQGRTVAAEAGFSHSNLTIIATAISEVARNIVEYAKEGELRITLISDAARKGVEIIASDSGPGIGDISTVMRDGFSTGKGLGLGLPGAKRLMDDFAIVSAVGSGTTITMKKWVA